MFTVTWKTCRRKCRTCVALPRVQRGVQTWRPFPRGVREPGAWCGRTWRQKVASLAHVASGSQVASPNVASKRGVTCQRGVGGRQNVASLAHWRQGVRCRGRTWRQNVASLAHGVGSQVSWPDVTSKRGVTGPRSVRYPGGVAGRGVKIWRHLPTWRQGARWRRRTWRQNVRHWPTSRQGARWRRRTWRQNVASLAYVASGSQVASQDVASKCGVTCLRGVREPCAVAGALPALTRVASLGVAERGVKMWRHWPTWRQGARWRRRTWRQNVASLAYVASGSQVASQDVASKCGVTCLRGVREPCAVAGALPALTRVASLGVAERGVKMWRHLPTWRQGATWRRRTWRQNVASGAIDLRGVTGRGVKTWRHEARPPGTCFKMCLQSSGDMCTPTGDHPVYITCMHVYIYRLRYVQFKRSRYVHINMIIMYINNYTHIYIHIRICVDVCE